MWKVALSVRVRVVAIGGEADGSTEGVGLSMVNGVWGCPEAGDAAGVELDDGVRQLKQNGNLGAEEHHRSNGCGNKRETEELAEHAVVAGGRQGREVAMTMMLHTLHALNLGAGRRLMLVERGDDHHWHEDGQEQPRGDMSLAS